MVEKLKNNIDGRSLQLRSDIFQVLVSRAIGFK